MRKKSLTVFQTVRDVTNTLRDTTLIQRTVPREPSAAS